MIKYEYGFDHLETISNYQEESEDDFDQSEASVESSQLLPIQSKPNVILYYTYIIVRKVKK